MSNKNKRYMKMSNENKWQNIQKMRSTSVFTFLKSNQKVSIRNIKTRIRRTGMRITSSEGKVFSPNCEVETRREDDGGTVKVRFAYTLVGFSCLEGNVSWSKFFIRLKRMKLNVKVWLRLKKTWHKQRF